MLGNTRFISRVRNLVFPRTMYYSLFILKHNQPMTKPVHIGGVVAQEYIFLEIYTPPPAHVTDTDLIASVVTSQVPIYVTSYCIVGEKKRVIAIISIKLHANYSSLTKEN